MLSTKSATDAAAITASHKDFFDSDSALPTADLNRFKNISFRSGGFKQAAELKDFHGFARPAAETTDTFELLALKTFFAYSHPFAPDEEAEVHHLFANLCFIDHSCKLSAALTWNEKKQAMVLTAMFDTDEGDEILISYLENPIDPKSDKHQRLGFPCKCDVCCSKSSAVVEAAYAELNTTITLVYVACSQLPGRSPPLNLRSADWHQTCAIARIAGPPQAFRRFSDRVTALADKLCVKHISFAAVYEPLSTALLAWFLTHTADKGKEKLLSMAAVAKAGEVGVLYFCLGVETERTERAVGQLCWMAKESRNWREVFCWYMRMAGLGVQMVRRVEGDEGG